MSLRPRLRYLIALLLALALVACSASSDAETDALTDTPAETPGDAPGEIIDSAEADTSDDAAEPWPWPTCPDKAAAGPSLADKAAYLDALMPGQHLDTTDRLLRTVLLDDEGQVAERLHVPSTGLWTAIYLASQALRYATTGDPEAIVNARVAAAGLHDLTMVTGTHGLYGRAYHRPDVAYAGYNGGHPVSEVWIESSAPGYEGWWWNCDVSKDTMDGILFGYAVALEHFDDPEIVDTITADLLAFTRRFVADKLTIVDYNGAVTEHGHLNYSVLDDFPGFNAMLSSSFLRTGIDSGAEELTHFFEDCMMRIGDRSDCPAIDGNDLGSYMDVIEDWLHVYRAKCQTSYDNFDMVFHAIYPWLRRETIPDLRERLLAVLDVGIWQRPDPDIKDAPPLSDSTHSLYIMMYGALSGASADDPIFYQALEEGICTLYEIPQDRVDRAIVANAEDYDVACINRVQKPNTDVIIPLQKRNIDNYIWRLDPYEIPTDHAGNPKLIHSAEDYLLAYWLGRYHGFLKEDM